MVFRGDIYHVMTIPFLSRCGTFVGREGWQLLRIDLFLMLLQS
jgi:hypothetical protein